MIIIPRYLINFITIIFILIVSCSFSRCNYNFDSSEKILINFKDSVHIYVKKTTARNKIVFLNDSIGIYKSTALIFKNHKPQWIFARYYEELKKDSAHTNLPTIEDIVPPYTIIKPPKTNLLQIIKSKDTLLFNFDDIDPVDLIF